MVAETLKKIWNKLRSKHVHRIVETGNQDFSHHTFATFCDNIPATSTTIADATQRQAVVSISEANSEYSFAISPTNSETFFEQQPDLNISAKIALENSFQRYFGNPSLFVIKFTQNQVDAYNNFIHFKHVRDTLEQMIDFFANQNHRMDGSEFLIESYFRCFYDFILNALYELEHLFPGIKNYHTHRQSARFRRNRCHLPSVSNSSGYNSCVSASYGIRNHFTRIL